MPNRKWHSRKPLFCGENASVYEIHVHQFLATFIWNNTSHLLSITTILIPPNSGFPSKVDAFSKCHFFFQMVHVFVCPAIGVVSQWYIRLSPAFLMVLLATWQLSFCIAPQFCIMAASGQQLLTREWGKWELGIQKVTQTSWGGEEWRDERRKSRGTEGRRKCNGFAIYFLKITHVPATAQDKTLFQEDLRLVSLLWVTCSETDWVKKN